MERIDLVGNWILPDGSGVVLETDGSARFTATSRRADQVGTWRYIDQRHFETAEKIPEHPDWGHNPDAYDYLSYYEIIQSAPNRIVVVGYEGGAEGLERDPVSWTRA